MANNYEESAKYAGVQGTSRTVGLIQRADIKDRLLDQRTHHEAQIRDIDRTLTLLSKNPDIEELLNLTRTLL